MEMALKRLGKDAAPALAGILKPIYLDAYSESPYEYGAADADEFVERFLSQSERPAFTLILGEIAGSVAGFSYGFIFPQDMWWRGAKDEPPPEIAAGTKFAVIELVVHRPYRGRGFSRRLLEALLADRGEDFAILLANPHAKAHAMYQRWGWTRVGAVQSYPHWPVDDALVLDLRTTGQSIGQNGRSTSRREGPNSYIPAQQSDR